VGWCSQCPPCLAVHHDDARAAVLRDVLARVGRVVGPGGYYTPSQQTYIEPSLIDLWHPMTWRSTSARPSPGRYCSTRHQTHSDTSSVEILFCCDLATTFARPIAHRIIQCILNPGCLSLMASYDVASNVFQAVPRWWCRCPPQSRPRRWLPCWRCATV